MKIRRFNEDNLTDSLGRKIDFSNREHAEPPGIVPQEGGGGDCIVEHKEMLIKSLQTLFFSWGGDTPSESYWAGNQFLEWFEAQFQIQLNERFDEEAHHQGNDDNFGAVIEAIRNC